MGNKTTIERNEVVRHSLTSALFLMICVLLSLDNMAHVVVVIKRSDRGTKCRKRCHLHLSCAYPIEFWRLIHLLGTSYFICILGPALLIIIGLLAFAKIQMAHHRSSSAAFRPSCCLVFSTVLSCFRLFSLWLVPSHTTCGKLLILVSSNTHPDSRMRMQAFGRVRW